MRFTEILLLLLVGWTVIGAIGVTLSFLKGEHAKARKNLVWIAGIWGLYLVVLLGTSFVQKKRIVAAGTPQCFDQLCFTVTGMETLPGYLMQQGAAPARQDSCAKPGRNTAERPAGSCLPCGSEWPSLERGPGPLGGSTRHTSACGKEYRQRAGLQAARRCHPGRGGLYPGESGNRAFW